MRLFKHYFKKSESWMHIYWVRHDGFGLLQRLKVNYTDRGGLFFYFLFTWWKLEWYRVKTKKAEKHHVRSKLESNFYNLHDR